MYFPKPAINENDLAIIERGDTASHSIEAGQYVSWKGKLGKANAAILQGATLDDSLFEYEESGVLSYLSNYIIAQTFALRNLSGSQTKTGTVTIPEGYTLLSQYPIYCFASGNESIRFSDINLSCSGTTVTISAYAINPGGVSGYSLFGAFLLKRI